MFGPVIYLGGKNIIPPILFMKKNPRVFKHFEYIKLKNNYFLQHELHHTKLLYYFENVAKLYEIGGVLLMTKNANLSAIFF